MHVDDFHSQVPSRRNLILVELEFRGSTIRVASRRSIRPDYIEQHLAHAVRDPNGRAHNRTAFLPERREMMQQWADYLDQLKTSSAGTNQGTADRVPMG